MTSRTTVLVFSLILLLTAGQSGTAKQQASIVTHSGVRYAVDDLVARGTRAQDRSQVAAWCSGLGGSLPSVHSKADVDFLHKLATASVDRGFLFLGGTTAPAGKSSSQLSVTWQDGTQSDFPIILNPAMADEAAACTRQQQQKSECGLALIARIGSKKVDKTFAVPREPYALTGVRVCRLSDGKREVGPAAAGQRAKAALAAGRARKAG